MEYRDDALDFVRAAVKDHRAGAGNFFPGIPRRRVDYGDGRRAPNELFSFGLPQFLLKIYQHLRIDRLEEGVCHVEVGEGGVGPVRLNACDESEGEGRILA